VSNFNLPRSRLGLKLAMAWQGACLRVLKMARWCTFRVSLLMALSACDWPAFFKGLSFCLSSHGRRAEFIRQLRLKTAYERDPDRLKLMWRLIELFEVVDSV
jgi:hypothetical protein